MTPAKEVEEASLALAATRPYGRLSDPLADLLDRLAAEMEARGAVEGSASKAVHPASPLGFGLSAPRSDWTAALKVARVVNGGAS